MKHIITIIALLFLILPGAQGQRKIIVDGDTLVAITPTNLGTINSLLEDRHWLQKEVFWRDSLNRIDSVDLAVKDSTIATLYRREALKEELYKSELRVAKKKNLKKNALFGGGGLLLCLLLGLLL